MIDALHIANSGLTANQAWIDSISNNVANMQSVGFKRSQVNFHNLVRSGGVENAAAATGMGAGVELGSATLDFSTGDVRSTNGMFDVAIQGKGFFEVSLSSGETVYTRIGAFHVNKDGELTLPDGQVLTADIRIPADAETVKIQADGVVKATIAQTGEVVEVGVIRLASFAQPDSLEQVGSGFYRKTVAAGELEYSEPGQAGNGVLLQGHLESSNVNMVSEMTDLMLAQRAYQLNARILQTSDQILETINNIRR